MTMKKFEYKYSNEGRWNSRYNRRITPEDDFRTMAKKAKVSVTELWDRYKILADLDQPGFSQFCKFILSGVDRPQNASRSHKTAP